MVAQRPKRQSNLVLHTHKKEDKSNFDQKKYYFKPSLPVNVFFFSIKEIHFLKKY